MLYAIKLGPLQTREGPVSAYVGIRHDGYLVGAVMGTRDKDALRQLAAESDSGEQLFCEGKLARAGNSLGFERAPMPAWVPLRRASVAVALALGPLVRGSSGIDFLCLCAAEFLRASPWRYWTDNDPIEVVVEGTIQARYEGALMGAAGMEFGVALYDRAGAVERVARAIDEGRRTVEDSIAVTLDSKPRFAIAALKDAYGLERLPVPIKMLDGRAVTISSEEVAILGGTLRLLATLTPQRREAALPLCNEEHEIQISIAMPAVVS